MSAVLLLPAGMSLPEPLSHAAPFAAPATSAARGPAPVEDSFPTRRDPGSQATAGVPLGLAKSASAHRGSRAGRPNPPVLDAGALDGLVLAAYGRAVARAATDDPGCAITWPVLAAIGRVESDNGRDTPAGGGIEPDGTITPPILGPALNGGAGFAAIRDGAGWARATGPMQFIPSTWARWGADGNGDGRRDPNNVFDASLAAARYLCAGGGSLADAPTLADAINSYNHSREYVRLVLELVAAYQHTNPALLLNSANLNRIAPGTTMPVARVVTEPAPASHRAAPPGTVAPARWTPPALHLYTGPGVAVFGSPLAKAPASARGALTLIATPTHGQARVVGTTLRYQPDAAFTGRDSFRYAVAGSAVHAAVVVDVRPGSVPTAPPAPSPTPAPSPPTSTAVTAAFSQSLTTSANTTTLTGHDTATVPSGDTVSFVQRWTFALTPATPGGHPQLLINGDAGSGTWTITRSAVGARVYVFLARTISCAAGAGCSASTGPVQLTVSGGTLAGVQHTVQVSATGADGAVVQVSAQAVADPIPPGGAQLDAANSSGG